jgi:sugar phosphate isomerase/epimerase
MTETNIALQLYTLRELTARDMLGTLGEVRKLGFRAVEMAGFGGVSPQRLHEELDSLGLQVVALHIGLDDLETKPAQVLADARLLDSRYIVIPYVAEERRRSVEQVAELGRTLDRYGEICREAGVRLAYHNHDFEFQQLGGSTMFDILVESTSPELVAFELDLYWARYADKDPAELLKRLTDRVPLLHAKDMADDEKRADLPAGEGTLPWLDILYESACSGVEWYIIEMDHPREPLVDSQTALRNLAQMLDQIEPLDKGSRFDVRLSHL